MTDRELLELAAKAAGYGEVWYLEGRDTPYIGNKYKIGGPVSYRSFSPLTDDGDALRLAVKLHICTLFPMRGDTFKQCGAGQVGSAMPACMEPHDPDPYSATRRAIVRAAAEIGRNMSADPQTVA